MLPFTQLIDYVTIMVLSARQVFMGQLRESYLMLKLRRQARGIALFLRPLGVEYAAPINALIRVCAEVVTLGLDQVGWQV